MKIGQKKGWRGREMEKNQQGKRTNCMCIRFVRMFESKKTCRKWGYLRES